MKKNLLVLALLTLACLGGSSAKALAWDDGESFGDKWSRYWESTGKDLDSAGRSFRDTFLKPNSDD